MRRFPRRWWVAGAGAVVAIEIVFVWLAPVVLDPIFNRYEDLPQGRTRAAVTELARKAGVDVGDVLVVDASRRTTAANAYVGGLGHTKRVVLYDTLLERFDPAQVELVVAHELAHVKQRDLARGMLWVAIVAPPGMYLVMLLTRRWSARAGVEPGAPGSLPALALALALVAFGLGVVSNQLSRAVENRADAYSLELTGEPGEFIELERRLALANVTDPDPPDAYQLVFGTHPETVERIGIALAYERGR
jgi:STE24 endopeptidase